MRGGQVRLALYSLLVLVFLLLPPSDPALASPEDPPTITGDELDQYRPKLPWEVNTPPLVFIQCPALGQEYLLGNGILMVFNIEDPDDSEWLLSWEVFGPDGYEEQMGYTRIVSSYSRTLRDLPLGDYHLTVYLRDGESQATAVVEFMVVTEYSEPASAEADPAWYAICCIGSFLVIVPFSYYLIKRRQASVERSRASSTRTRAAGTFTTSPPPRSSYPQVYTRPPLPPALPKQVPPTTLAPYPMDSERAEPPPAHSPGDIEPLWPPLQSQPSPLQSSSQPSPPPPLPIPPSPLPMPPLPLYPPPPSQAVVEDWRVGSPEEFVDLIPELPEGLPEPLWGIEWWTLGREMMSTSQLRSDGQSICTVKGRQFHADKRDMDTFMQEVED